jgi:hypothetical protein
VQTVSNAALSGNNDDSHRSRSMAVADCLKVVNSEMAAVDQRPIG